MEISSAAYNEQGDNESHATSRNWSIFSMELQWLRIPDSALRFSLKSYLYKVNKHEIITFKLAAAIHKRIHYYRTAADIQYCSLSNMCYSVLHKLPLLKGTGCSSQNQGTQRMKWIGSLDQQGWTQPPLLPMKTKFII